MLIQSIVIYLSCISFSSLDQSQIRSSAHPCFPSLAQSRFRCCSFLLIGLIPSYSPLKSFLVVFNFHNYWLPLIGPILLIGPVLIQTFLTSSARSHRNSDVFLFPPNWLYSESDSTHCPFLVTSSLSHYHISHLAHTWMPLMALSQFIY